MRTQSNYNTLSLHQKLIQSVSKVATQAIDMGILVNTTEDVALDGRHIHVQDKKLLHFGNCSYLGLDQDDRLKIGAVDAVIKYGTQFSSSRAYLSSRFYEEAESKLSEIFCGQPVLLLQSLTVGHMSNIPILVGDNDAVLFDAKVHDSVQTALQLLTSRKIYVERIKHNNMDLFESRIIELRKTHKKIWYMADGVYSMQGHYAPVKELIELADRYEELHLYIDDIHGMSWCGPNGAGYVLNQTNYHPRLYLTTGLTKAFGSAGGVLVFPNKEIFTHVRNTCKAFTFSIQMPPMILGATIASADIHLSEEIYSMQEDLQLKILFFNAEAKRLGLPLINETNSPITFIGVGKPETGYNMVRRMMNKGYFINLSVFPSVAYNNTGLRITINRLHTFDDLRNLVHELAHQLQLELDSSLQSVIEIQRSFQQIA